MNIEFERCIDFLTRMIEKYGNEIVITEMDNNDTGLVHALDTNTDAEEDRCS